MTKLNPIDGECCYRDAHWSPDGKYIFFAFQKSGETAIELYYMSKIVFGEVMRIAAEIGIKRVAHGVNLDDLGDYRPGLKAAEEMGVVAPLAEAGLTKADIRALSRRMRLPTWNKPSMACLASRIPYGRPITPEALKMVEAAEEVLQRLGFYGCRVRHHGEVSRIEVVPGDLKKTMHPGVRAEIVESLKRSASDMLRSTWKDKCKAA